MYVVINTIITLPQVTFGSYLLPLESTEGFQLIEEKWMIHYSQLHHLTQYQQYSTPTQLTHVPSFGGVKMRKQISGVLAPIYSSDHRREYMK